MQRRMSSPNTTAVWVHVKWRLQVLKICAFLMGMSFLDLRDLWYKITWVGPYDSFAFNAGSRGTLLPKSLPMDMTIPPSLNQSEWTSGWPSYHSRCETLTPFCSPGSTFFLNAMGTKCQVGVLNETKVLPRLVMTSNVRSDSMAWGACQLLFDHRKPGICQQHIVSKFLERYHMRAEPVLREWLAQEGSAAEAELLRFLELIAMSHPKWKLICTGGFDYSTPGRYYPKIFGCASPNIFRTEFVGVYATNIYRLQFDKAWLTAIDIVSFVGIQYNIRQNTINYFDMDEETITNSTDGSTSVALSITETTANNFVSRGLLYVLMILIDILLLLSQMYTGLELVTEWIIPVMRKQDEKQFEEELQERLGTDTPLHSATSPEDVSFSKEEYTSALSTSLYRNNVIVLLTVISQMISWGIIIPNSVIWTWSLSNSAKLQAFLGSLRLWTLILIGANALWDVVVFFFERHAYYFARATYVTSFEVMTIGAICAYSKSADVMAISEIKFDLEHQRVNDVFSFAGFVAHGNTFNEDLDYSPNSRAHLLSVMYMPLIAIVGWSIFGVFLWLLVKLVIYWILNLPVVAGWMRNVKKSMGIKDPGVGVTSVSGTLEQLNRKKLMNSAHMQDPIERLYKRVELEHMLNIPMRARSLIRATLSMQKMVRGEVIIRPPVHLDFGVLIRDRVVTARTGFRSTMRSMMELSPPPVSKSMRTITTATINATDFAGLGELKNHQHPSPQTPEKQPAAKQRGNAFGGKSYGAVHAAEE